MKTISAFLFASAITITTASAHHGQDFILLEDYHLPSVGSGHLLTNFEWEKGSDGSEFGFSPSLMFGVLPRVALSVETDFRDEVADGWQYSSVTPMAHFQLSPPDSKSPIRFGLSAGYQFGNADPEVADEHAAHDHADEHADEHGEEHADEHDHAAHSHGGGSVHAHGVDAFVGRFVVEGDFGDTKVVFNLLSVVDDNDANWGYAAGVRHKVASIVALGVEALGDFKSDGWHEIVAGAYVEPIHSLTLKVGVGFGLTEATPDFTLRTGFIYRF
jgi:hypothetical protein